MAFVGPLPQGGKCAKCGKPFHVKRRPCCCAGKSIDVIRDGKWVAETFEDGYCVECCTHAPAARFELDPRWGFPMKRKAA